MTNNPLRKIREKIEKAHLTGFSADDMKEAAEHLESHSLPTLFSYREAYFVGAEAQFSKIMKVLEEGK